MEKHSYHTAIINVGKAVKSCMAEMFKVLPRRKSKTRDANVSFIFFFRNSKQQQINDFLSFDAHKVRQNKKQTKTKANKKRNQKYRKKDPLMIHILM